MNNALKYAFVFAAGAAVGSVVTWKLLHTQYEHRVQAEVDDVKKVLLGKETEPAKEVNTVEEPPEKPKKKNGLYNRMVQRLGYADGPDSLENEEEPKDDGPYVICADEFGSKEDYDCVGFTYHADDVLANELGEKIDDIEAILGSVSLDRSEFEDDALYVRDDKIKIDYEIVLDEETYEELLERKPYLKKEE